MIIIVSKVNSWIGEWNFKNENVFREYRNITEIIVMIKYSVESSINDTRFNINCFHHQDSRWEFEYIHFCIRCLFSTDDDCWSSARCIDFSVSVRCHVSSFLNSFDSRSSSNWWWWRWHGWIFCDKKDSVSTFFWFSASLNRSNKQIFVELSVEF